MYLLLLYRALHSYCSNNIWALSRTYNKDAHNVMVAYQQNIGNVGYDYTVKMLRWSQSIYLPNSYLSDFIGNDEKSVQASI